MQTFQTLRKFLKFVISLSKNTQEIERVFRGYCRADEEKKVGYFTPIFSVFFFWVTIKKDTLKLEQRLTKNKSLTPPLFLYFLSLSLSLCLSLSDAAAATPTEAATAWQMPMAVCRGCRCQLSQIWSSARRHKSHTTVKF